MYRVHILLDKTAPCAQTDRLNAANLAKIVPGVMGCTYGTRLQSDATQHLPSDYGAVLDLWFNNPADAATAADADVSALLQDGAIVRGVFLGMQRVVMRMPHFKDGEGIKGVYVFGRKAGMSLKDFNHHWWHTHGPIAALTENAGCYIQSHADGSLVSPLGDGITELYWPDAETAAAAISSRQMTEDQAGDAPNFVENGSVSLFLANQSVVIAP